MPQDFTFSAGVLWSIWCDQSAHAAAAGVQCAGVIRLKMYVQPVYVFTYVMNPSGSILASVQTECWSFAIIGP